MWFMNLLGFLIFFAVLALVAVPLWLVIQYPDQASHVTEISKAISGSVSDVNRLKAA